MRKKLDRLFHQTISLTGWDFIKRKHLVHTLEIGHFLKLFKIGTILDVGANEGQFGIYIRSCGYKNQIISFEPIKDAFQKLELLANNDDKWVAFNYGLGNTDGQAIMNVSENSVSSSVLEIKASHLESAPKSRYIKTEPIILRRLDSVFNELIIEKSNIFLKSDTQGFEKHVLEGAVHSLEKITLVQLEMATKPLYEGEDLFYKLSEFMYDKGFHLIKIFPAFTNPVGELLQFDGIFARDLSR